MSDQKTQSPSKLMQFIRSPFASWMDRYNRVHSVRTPRTSSGESDSSSMRMFQKAGDAHELAYLEMLKTSGLSVCELSRDLKFEQRWQETMDAMKAGYDVIFQAYLWDSQMAGYSDFLMKIDGASNLGDYHYEVWDTKLAQHVKPYFVFQLCCYSELLARIQGRMPQWIGLVLGTGEKVSYRTIDFYDSYLTVKEDFLELVSRDIPKDATRPIPKPNADHQPYQELADGYLIEIDHLSQVANITKTQIKKLEAVGICTMRQLSSSPLQAVQGLRPVIFERLKKQATLQIDSMGLPRPLYEVIMPPEDDPKSGLGRLPVPSAIDVFFDMEGYPLIEGNLEYLFGATIRTADGMLFKDFWAHDAIEEKRTFEAFIDWVYARWIADPTMHIYHYAAYEVTAMRRLMGRYATREMEVDNLLRGEVFVDLYKVVKQGLFVGEPSYSIKNLEHLYRDARTTEVTSGDASIVAYHEWRQNSDHSTDPQKDPHLKMLYDYNKDDCDSTLELTDWLRARAQEAGIPYAPPKEGREGVSSDQQPGNEDAQRREALRLAMLDSVEENDSDACLDSKVTVLLAELLLFYHREEKPFWWHHFDCVASEPEELLEDSECLACLRYDPTDPGPELRSSIAWVYRFDPNQETKRKAGEYCYIHHAGSKVAVKIQEIDLRDGRLALSMSKSKLSKTPDVLPVPEITLLPGTSFGLGALKDAIERAARDWHEHKRIIGGVSDLLYRRAPRLKNQDDWLLRPGESTSQRAVRLVTQLDETTLAIQGPPGTGKTYTGAHMIFAAVQAGMKVGIVANSHKAVDNLMLKTSDLFSERGVPLEMIKSSRKPSVDMNAEFVSSSVVAARMAGGAQVVGSVSWTFARPDMKESLDVLFVDEAGQFSMAHLIACSQSTKNIVLLGDPQQLPQPLKGTHPGDTSLSALQYLLQANTVIPADMGLFLEKTWRMRPELCSFISSAFYDDQLDVHPDMVQRSIPDQNGIHFVAVEHYTNTSTSSEEVDRIAELIKELRATEWLPGAGEPPRKLTLDDILVVAPYNAQVNRLKERLPDAARVGTVDKFQGQEAAVVIVSMTCSNAEEAPRAMDFLFSPNRINVAISRAQCAAFVVASPQLARPLITTTAKLKLSNVFTRIRRNARPRMVKE